MGGIIRLTQQVNEGRAYMLIRIEIERNIWSCLYGGVYSFNDCLSRPWGYKDQYSKRQCRERE